MKTTAIGIYGEQLAVEWLERSGFLIVERNFKTRWCEIDIVATKSNILYFVEVKYRKNDNFGNGFEYITAKKVQQMRFAAEFWIQSRNYQGACQLAAASVNGESKDVEFIADL